MSLSAVLLAGGESRRMGRDKATLSFRGRPIWQNQFETLRSLNPSALFLSARENPEWRPTDTIFVADIPPSRGPLSGLSVALSLMTSSHLIALAVDMPFMTSEYLRNLSDKIQPGCGVLPMFGDRAEPLAAIYPREARSHLAAALESRDFSLHALMRALVQAGRLKVVHVGKAEEHLFRNLNEPGDLVADDFVDRRDKLVPPKDASRDSATTG